ncbi:MAG: hypothetical protein HKN03_01005 [Acidimicrobiales bacterium]|nr:hypothetical protein [Acidimicrobiales bacterium]
MKTLEHQLADYGDRQRELHGPITAAELIVQIDQFAPVQPLRPVVQSARFRPPQQWLVAVAAAAAVLVLVGAGAMLFRVTSSDSPVADTIAPTTLVESSQTTLAESSPTTLPEFAASSSWSRVPHHEAAAFGGEGEQGMSSVTVGGPGLVAVGWENGYAAVWTSADGLSWSQVAHDEAVFGGRDTQMRSVSVGGPGLVAVGWEDEVLDEDAEPSAAVWTSVDGSTWSRVPHDEDVFGAALMTSVTAGGPGLVAVGMTTPGGDGNAAVWTSDDGFNWTRVPHDETVFGGVDRQVIHDVTVGGPGLVAVGNDGGRGWWDNNPGNNAAVWTSVDGFTWSRVSRDEPVFSDGGNPVMLSVTAGGPGLVAVGADSWLPELARTPVWTSPDGFTWTRVPDDETVRGSMTSVTAGGPGLVAVGSDRIGSDTSEATAVWTSVDGIKWSRVPHDDAVFGKWPDWINDVTLGGPGLLAVGVHGGDAAVWVAVPEG